MTQKTSHRQAAVSHRFIASAKNTFTVPHDLTLSQRVGFGKYDWMNKNINEQQFPHNTATVGEWQYDLCPPNLPISSKDAKLSAEVDGWVVAEAEHGLAFASTFPDAQRVTPIVMLGSVCVVDDYRCVLVLWNDDGRRTLQLLTWDRKWSSRFRFLCVRKVKPSVA